MGKFGLDRKGMIKTILVLLLILALSVDFSDAFFRRRRRRGRRRRRRRRGFFRRLGRKLKGFGGKALKVIKSPGALGALSMIPGLGAISGIVGAVGNIASAAKGEGSIVDKLGAIAGATGNAMSQLKIKGAEKFGNFAAGLQDKIGAVKNVISNVKEGGLSNIQGIVGSLKGLKGAFGRGGAPPQDVQAPPPVAQQPAYQPKAQPQPQGRPTQQEIQAAIEHLKKKFPFGVPDGSNPQKMIMDRVMEQRQQSNNAGTSQQPYTSFGRTQSPSNVPPPPPAAPAPPVATPAPH